MESINVAIIISFILACVEIFTWYLKILTHCYFFFSNLEQRASVLRMC